MRLQIKFQSTMMTSPPSLSDEITPMWSRSRWAQGSWRILFGHFLVLCLVIRQQRNTYRVAIRIALLYLKRAFHVPRIVWNSLWSCDRRWYRVDRYRVRFSTCFFPKHTITRLQLLIVLNREYPEERVSREKRTTAKLYARRREENAIIRESKEKIVVKRGISGSFSQ